MKPPNGDVKSSFLLSAQTVMALCFCSLENTTETVTMMSKEMTSSCKERGSLLQGDKRTLALLPNVNSDSALFSWFCSPLPHLHAYLNTCSPITYTQYVYLMSEILQVLDFQSNYIQLVVRLGNVLFIQPGTR